MEGLSEDVTFKSRGHSRPLWANEVFRLRVTLQVHCGPPPRLQDPGTGAPPARTPASLTRARLIREPSKLLRGSIRPLREG